MVCDLEIEVMMSDYITVAFERRVTTEFVDSKGRRKASAGIRKRGRPYDVTARICYEDGRKCFVRGKTAAGRELVETLKAA